MRPKAHAEEQVRSLGLLREASIAALDRYWSWSHIGGQIGNGQSLCTVDSFLPMKVSGFEGFLSCPAVARVATSRPIAMKVFLIGTFLSILNCAKGNFGYSNPNRGQMRLVLIRVRPAGSSNRWTSVDEKIADAVGGVREEIERV
jgi:hypothetical protein